MNAALNDTQAPPEEEELLLSASYAEAGKKRIRKRRIARIVRLIIILAIIAAVVLVYARFKRRRGEQAGAENVYSEYTVGRSNIIETLSGTGALEPADSYAVSTLIEGEIMAADFEEGDIVEKDAVLYSVDSSNTSSSIERAQLTLSRAQTDYQRKLGNREKLEVKAPGTGRITSINVEPGDNVASGQTVATIIDSSVMTIVLPFPSDDAESFYAGQSAEVTMDGSFETVPGTVTKISPSDTVLSGNMIVRQVAIEVSNPGALSTEQTATAVIDGASCSGSGTFTYRGTWNVVAETSGKVAQIHADEGGSVSKNQTVVTLSSDTIDDEIQNSYNSVRDAEISLENQYEQLESYTITSPISGTVIEKGYKAGDTLSAGKILCTIYDLSYLTFTMNIDELDIKKVEVGQQVSVTADAIEGQVFMGVITKISVQGVSSGGVTSYPVTVRIDEADGLLPGMNVNASVVLKSAENVLTVPIAAVSRGNRVLVKTDTGAGADTSSVPDMNAGGRERPGTDEGPGNIPNMSADGTERPGTDEGPGNIPNMSAEGNTDISGRLAELAPEGYKYVEVKTGVSDGNFVEILEGLKEGDVVAYISPAAGGGQVMFYGSPVMGGPGGGAVSSEVYVTRGGGDVTVARPGG